MQKLVLLQNKFRIEHIDFFKIRGLKYKIGPLQNKKIQMQQRIIHPKTNKINKLNITDWLLQNNV